MQLLLVEVKLQSWTKFLGQFALVAVCTHVKQRFTQDSTYTCPASPYNVENMYLQFFPTFNMILGGGGGDCNRVLKYSCSAFFQSNAQITNNYSMSFA